MVSPVRFSAVARVYGPREFEVHSEIIRMDRTARLTVASTRPIAEADSFRRSGEEVMARVLTDDDAVFLMRELGADVSMAYSHEDNQDRVHDFFLAHQEDLTQTDFDRAFDAYTQFKVACKKPVLEVHLPGVTRQAEAKTESPQP